MEIIKQIDNFKIEQLQYEVELALSLKLDDTDGFISSGTNSVTFDFIVDLTSGEQTTLDTTVTNHVVDNDWEEACHRICDDVDPVIAEKPIYNINYKTELESGISYTPVYTIGDIGTQSGLLEKTDYYRDFVNNDNMGVLILTVEEEYTFITESNVEYTRIPVSSRTKYWKYYMDDGTIDTTMIKSKVKKYDTRTKRHIEGVKRRTNVIEQLIDNVGLAGVLSGVFTGATDAHTKLTDLEELHANAFTAWSSSGLGSLTESILNDTDTTWLSSTVADTPYTQAMCPWMIGMTFKDYISEKLKGNVR